MQSKNFLATRALLLTVFICLLVTSAGAAAKLCRRQSPATDTASFSSANGAKTAYRILAAESIEKPEGDQREHMYIELENKMKVLLVSDPEAQTSAASVSVKAGYFLDPPEWEGIAHLTEHLLFRGNKEYQGRNEFHDFLALHNGDANAQTLGLYTNYEMLVDSDFLEDALKRFGALFKQPLFLESIVTSELDVVDSEFKTNFGDNYHREIALHQSLYNQASPYSKLGFGSFETLRDPADPSKNLTQAVKSFFKDYYSANLMKVFVLGKEPLETLARLVNTAFSSIPIECAEDPNLQLPVTPWTGMSDPQIMQYIQAESFTNQNSLFIRWILPTNVHWWDMHVESYINNLFERKGNGSFFYILKEKGWVLDLFKIDNQEGYGKSFAIFGIELALTSAGAQHIDSILVHIFQYIEVLKTSDEHERYFKEYQRVDTIHFMYKNNGDALQFAHEQAMLFHLPYPPERVVSGGYVSTAYNETLIRQTLAQFDRFQMTLLASKEHLTMDLSLTERYFGTRYAVAPIPASLLQRIKAAPRHGGMFLPKPNPFVPTNLAVQEHLSVWNTFFRVCSG